MGLFSAIFGGEKENIEESDVDKCLRSSDPVNAQKVLAAAGVKRVKNIYSLYDSKKSMSRISEAEQGDYIHLINEMHVSTSESGEENVFEYFLFKVKEIHFKGNTLLGAYLRTL
jgi:hypothetical protein